MKTQTNVPGWEDTSIGASNPEAKGLFKTWPDPRDQNNVVYGTKQSSGKPEGRNPRIGTFSTLTDRRFEGRGRFEYRGRFLRTDGDGRIGLSFFSSHPEADRYYLIGLWTREDSPLLTMQLFAFGGGIPAGTLDSSFTPPPGEWTRFMIQADDVDGKTRIRARFWRDGSPEPRTFAIDAIDAAASRLTGGHIGIWAAVKGEAFVDDLQAKAPVDTTPPAIAFTGYTDGMVIATPIVRVGGHADDAVSVAVNGLPATIDAEARTFLSSDIHLLEGVNEISATGADEVGNRVTIVLRLVLDTRAPEIAVATPAAGACLDVPALVFTGTVVESHLRSLRVGEGEAFAEAAVDSVGRWAATLPTTEGPHAVVVEGLDALGHRQIVPLSLLVDRTPPAVEIVSADGPVPDGIVANRPLSFFVSVRDLDRAPGLQLRLGPDAYAQGTPVSAEGAHTLNVIATDCAGHRTERNLSFGIDMTPPQFGSFSPSQGSRVGTLPSSVTGSVSADAVSVAVVGTAVAAVPADGSFTLSGLTFVEGENRFPLRATDRAGNVGETEYRLTLATTPPSIEVLENGAPIAEGALFNREVRPEIRVSDAGATAVVTINGAPFIAGSAIGADGSYDLLVVATDDLGRSASRRVGFAIDRTPPAVAITAPQPGRVSGETVVVQGTAGDSVSASVNGLPSSMANGSFSATVPIEEGENVLVALGTDAAGNAGRAEVVVSRDSRATGVVITAPADGFVTNRTTIRVAGRVLDPSIVATVTIGSAPVPVDATGAFELSPVALGEGENLITAIATAKSGGATSAAVRVIADRTAPTVRILESGRPLSDQARFAAGASLALETSDDRELATAAARLDGSEIALPATVSSTGGHTIAAVAVDAAGNETRVERTFFVGGADGVTRCALGSFNPPSGSVIALGTTGLTGHIGAAAGVKVNGVPAAVANGSFCATVELPIEGENTVEIVCLDAGGSVFGAAASVKLIRSTAAPGVSVDLPAEAAAVGNPLISVSGTAGPGVVEVTVNGEPASIGAGDSNVPRPFSIDGVRLIPGLNLLLVRAATAAGRPALATRRVLYLNDAPSLTITSPLPAQETGSATTTLSGLWTGIDPATLAVAGSAAVPEIGWFGDRSGSFRSRDLPLTIGESSLTISGRDALGRLTAATVSVTREDLAPFIEITAPRDHGVFGSHLVELQVAGTATAANGARVEINGRPATIGSTEVLSESRARYSFTASVPFATLGTTPVVARVTEPSGRGAFHAIRVSRLAAVPRVERVFPEDAAIGVDPGAMPVVVFSVPMDRSSFRCGAADGCAFRLEGPGGSLLSGVLDVDRDAITFAPAVPLEDGVEYTIRVTTAAKDAGGVPLEREHVSRFRVGLAAAPTAAPALDPLPAKHCGTTLAIAGSAPAGARVKLDVGPSTFDVTAAASGRFAYDARLTGEAGYLLVRARTIASGGSLSAASHSCVLIDCGGLGVASAAYDRDVNRLTISFTAPVDLSTATAESIRLVAGGSAIPSAIALTAPATLLVTPSEDLGRRSFTLEITGAIRGADGTPLSAPFAQLFPFDSGEPAPGDGTGFVSGEIYDASTGRPLGGARVTVETPLNAFAESRSASGAAGADAAVSDPRGRYALRLSEGAHTLRVGAEGYTTAWRQIIVPAGAGVTPIDIRLQHRAEPAKVASLPLLMAAGGDAATARAALEIPLGSAPTGANITLTSVGAQSLAGLLPLGWSPLGAAEIVIEGGELSAATLSFDIPAARVSASGKSLSLVRYDPDRDEWRVVAAAVPIAADSARASITSAGSYALVYGDAAAPPLASGAVLPAAADPCASASCSLVKKSFTLEPANVLPDQSAVATLVIDGNEAFASGTAIQAWIDEQLTLADGTILLDPPFAADLVLYRTIEGAEATAVFRVAPSPRAAEVILESGVDHVRVRPYPGRLARGTLVGPEGGRIPSDENVSVEIPTGAVSDPVRASASSLAADEIASFGAIGGFRIVGGVSLELARVDETPSDRDGDGVADAPIPVVLGASARVTFRVDAASLPGPDGQVVIAEVLGDTPYGRVIRLAARAVEVPLGVAGATLFATAPIDRSILPLDGVVREGRYLFLAAEAPIAFATGSVRRGGAGPFFENALVSAHPLGVEDLTRVGGLFVVPVPAAPAQPFSVIARHTAIGAGTAHLAPAAPEKNAVVVLGDLLLEAQPPQISSTVPQNAANAVSLTTSVRVQFDRALDPASVGADAIVVSGPTGVVAGTVTAEGPSAIHWSLPPGASLAPGAIYTARVAAQIRSSAGAPLGTAVTVSFATLAEIANGEVRPERFSITIPNASGASTVRGEPGALPSGWQAVAVRRAKDFVTRPQATAASNGELTFVAGGCASAPATCVDAISISDAVDLHVFNEAGSLAAVIPLTPFVNTERTGFVTRPQEATTFTSGDGIAVAVPAGAFDRPVLVTVVPKLKTALSEVPKVDEELRWSGAIELDLDCGIANAASGSCVAQERIELGIPAPRNIDPSNRVFLLGLLAPSVRGSRIMVVDALRIDRGRFTTEFPAASGESTIFAGSLLQTSESRGSSGVQVITDAKKFLPGAVVSGVYSVIDAVVPAGSSFGWSQIDVGERAYEIFNDAFESLFTSTIYLTESRGRVTIPILTNATFKISGYDGATGLLSFENVYQNPLADPGAVFLEDPAFPDEHGPYPVFGTPFRIESLDVDLESVDYAQIRNFTVRLEGGLIKASDASGDALPASVPVTLINPAAGALDTSRTDGLQVPGKRGDRIVLVVREENVDASSRVSIVFNEALFPGSDTAADAVDAFLKTRFKLEHRPASAPQGASFTDVTPIAQFAIDSGRRVSIDLPASLQLDSLYRLRIDKSLADVSGLQILQTKGGGETKGGLASDLVLEFITRAPGGSLAAFDIGHDANTQLGAIRDLALEGNVMYVSALEGGLVAYDVSNPAAMTSTTLPLSYVSGDLDDYWSAAVDHHGRIYSVALGNSFGVIRTFRAEQFLRGSAQTGPHVVQQQVGGGMVSWAPGYASSLPASTAAVLSDRPEAIPRKVQVLVQDDEDPPLERTAFKQAWSSMITDVEPLAAGAERLTMSIPIAGAPGYPYLLQRITVENVTAALRESGDARPGQPASIEIVARPRDVLRLVRNQRTYAAVSLFGYGVGILDMNALETNDSPNKPSGWKPLQEKIALTRASIEPDDSQPATWEVGEIPDLTFTPDAAIVQGSGGPNVLALDARRGVLDLPVRPQPSADGGETLGAARGTIAGLVFRATLGSEAYDHPRLKDLRAKFKALAGREPFGRFNTIAPYRWTLRGEQNLPLAPKSKYGQRGSQAGLSLTRVYAFIAGNEYGLLVVEAGGDAPLGLPHEPLSQQSLVDVIWIPAGASSVRVVPGWHVAAVIDGLGHLLLVDISRIDERFGKDGAPIVPATDLFPTASAALSADGAYGVGTRDPRILWRSSEPVAAGTLAPLIDPATGLVYAGRLLGAELTVIAALDPRLRVLVDLGRGFGETNEIVPLGFSQKKTADEGITGARFDPPRRKGPQ